jgi:hypothetical protein
MELKDYHDDVEKRRINAEKQEKKKEKADAKEQCNIKLTKKDLKKKKALGLDEGRSKRKHDKNANGAGSLKIQKRPANKKKKVVTDDAETEDSSEDEDDPAVHSGGNASPVNDSVDVNITSDITPKVKPRKAVRKMPATTMMMKKSVDPKYMEGGINLHAFIVDTPLASGKPGEKIPVPSSGKILAPQKKTTDEKKAKAKKKVPKAPKLIQPLASLPPTSPVKPDRQRKMILFLSILTSFFHGAA